MMIFLDTDTLSYFLQGNTAIRDRMQSAIDSGHQICLTSINVYEIIKGLKYKNNKNKEQDFRSFLESITTYTLDIDAIMIAAKIYSQLRKRGITISDADILIASIVMANAGTLITNNLRHYQHIDDLVMENWYIP